MNIQLPDLEAAIEKGITAGVNEWDDSKVHASDLPKVIEGEGCKRQLWLRLKGKPKKPLTLGQRLMFSNAYSIHDRVPVWLKAGLPSYWKVKEVETEIVGQEGTGRLDILLEHLPTGEVIVVDVKTIRGKAFDFLREPKKAHVVQVQTYCRAKGCKYAMLLYVDREGQNGFKTFTVLRDDAYIEQLWAEANAVAALEEPPSVLKPIIKISKLKTQTNVVYELPWQCTYCPFLDISCNGAAKKGVREFKAVVKGSVWTWDVEPSQDVKNSIRDSFHREMGKMSGQAERN